MCLLVGDIFSLFFLIWFILDLSIFVNFSHFLFGKKIFALFLFVTFVFIWPERSGKKYERYRKVKRNANRYWQLFCFKNFQECHTFGYLSALVLRGCELRLTLFLHFSYAFLTLFLRFSDAFLTLFLRFSYAVSTLFLRFSYAFLTLLLRFS